jgi:hypothetical protein
MGSGTVFRWYCPFELSLPVLERLEGAGGNRWDGDGTPPKDLPLALIVLPPDCLLLQPQKILEGYQRLQGLASSGFFVQLERLDPSQWGYCLSAQSEQGKTADSLPLKQPEPLEAILTLALLSEVPSVLDAYLDLELQAELFGGDPDTDYLRRLHRAASAEDALRSFQALTADLQELNGEKASLSGRLEAAESELLERKAAAEGQEEELHQVREELEAIFLADRSKQQRIDELIAQHAADLSAEREAAAAATATKAAEHEAHCQVLEDQLQVIREQTIALEQDLQELNGEKASLSGRLEAAESELLERKAAAEGQEEELHQVREELEHYFLLTRSQQDLLEGHQKAEVRSQKLLARLCQSSLAVGVVED